MVVAMTASFYSERQCQAHVSSRPPHIASDLLLDDVDEDVEKRYGFNHHTAIPRGEDAASEREDKLRDNASALL